MSEKKLYILTYDHGGYVLWKEKIRTQLDEAISWLRKYPKFRVGLDYESYTYDAMDSEDPSLNRKIAGALREFPGRFGIGSTTYGQPLSVFISEESNARQLIYSVRANLKHFGCTPPVYAISEFALHDQIPQLAKLCGFRAAILRSHVMGYGYTRTFGKAFGLWVGKDGTGIPAVPVYDGEGEGYSVTTMDNWILTRWPDGTDISLEDFEKKFASYEPLLASRYDDLTLRREGLPARAEEMPGWRFVLLEDLPEIYGETKEELRTTDNDFHVRMPWGYCGNEIFNGCRQAETAAAAAEKENAAAVLLGGAAEQEALEEAWRNVLIAQHHDVTICGLLELSRRFLPASLRASSDAADRSLAFLAGKLASPEGGSLVAFNPNSFSSRQWFESELDWSGADLQVLDGDRELPCEVLPAGKGRVRVRFAAELEPMAAHRFRLREGRAQTPAARFTWEEESGTLLTPDYRVVLSDAGIVSADDLKTGRRIAENGAGSLFRGWVEGADRVSSGRWRVETGPCSARAVQEGKIGGIPFRFEMFFAEGLRRIACRAEFTMNGERVGHAGLTAGLNDDQALIVNGFIHETKLRFVMNTCLSGRKRMVRDLPYTIADWDGEKVRPVSYWYPGRLAPGDTPAEEAPEQPTYLQGDYWTCLRESGRGVAIFNRGCMGTVVDGTRLSVPLIYSDEYMCGTRILRGNYESEFALFPFETDLSDLEIHREALGYEYPAAVRYAPRGNGAAQDVLRFASVRQEEGDGVILTALYPENGVVRARLCNYSPAAARASFSVVSGRVTAETDLLGNRLAPSDGKNLCFRAWEIKTLQVENQP